MISLLMVTRRYVAGLADDQMFNVQLGWQSVPVHSQNPEDDIVSHGVMVSKIHCVHTTSHTMFTEHVRGKVLIILGDGGYRGTAYVMAHQLFKLYPCTH